MPLPDNFDSFEHLQSTASRVLNRLVRKEFLDVGGDDWSPDISTPRSSLRVACTPKDDDTGVMLLLRFFLYYFTVRAGLDFAPQIYGLDQKGLEATARQYAIVKNIFIESRYDASTAERIPVQKQVSFRWRETNFTTANVRALATKIKNDLATPKLKWRCGRKLYTYHDRLKPYNFQVYGFDKSEAKKVIEAVHRIQDDIEPDWNKYLKYHELEDETPAPKFETIEGNTERLPDPYPIAMLEYAYSELYFPGVLAPRYLVDCTGTKPGAEYYV